MLSYLKKMIFSKNKLDSESNFYHCNICGSKTFGKPPHIYTDCGRCRSGNLNKGSSEFISENSPVNRAMEHITRKTQVAATFDSIGQLKIVGTSFYKGAMLDLNDSDIYRADLVEFKYQGEFAVSVSINGVRVGSIAESSLPAVKKYFIHEVKAINVLIKNKCSYPYITHLYDDKLTSRENEEYKKMNRKSDYGDDDEDRSGSEYLDDMPQLYADESYEDEPEFDSHADYDDHHKEY